MTVIGTYPICNNGGIIVHKFDMYEDKVLASMNGKGYMWCPIVEDPDGEPGFYYGKLYVAFGDVMRTEVA